MSGRLARVGVLLSGRGSNFLALDDAMRRCEVPAEVVLVASNLTHAAGLERARERGLPTVVVEARGSEARQEQEGRILAALAAHEVEWICLAGYMRLLSATFVRAHRERILNIHPSLLPAFPGLHAQRQALEHGVKVAGCTVHLVDQGLDSGAIIVQRAVPVHEEDDEASLSARILEQEHVAYPEALRRLLTERWRVEGRRVRFEPG